MLGGVHRETAKTLGAVESKADSVLSITAHGVAERITAPSQSCKTSARSHLPG